MTKTKIAEYHFSAGIIDGHPHLYFSGPGHSLGITYMPGEGWSALTQFKAARFNVHFIEPDTAELMCRQIFEGIGVAK